MPRQSKRYVLIIQVLIGLFLLFFYAKWCPLALYDTDDWIYIAYDRAPIPIWGGWNPSKVLPETLMPLVGRMSARWIYPITQDYVTAVTWGSAIVMSVLITALCYLVYRLIHHRMGVSAPLSIVAELLFLAGCYWIFRNRGGSRYLFYASSLNTTYNYTIPGIFNAITVLVMLQYDRFLLAYRQYKALMRILYWLLVYFSIFSSLFHSGILAVYCGTVLLVSMIRYLMDGNARRGNLCKWMIDNRIEIIVLFVWLVAVLFELCGGRASAVGVGEGFNLRTSAQQLLAMLRAFNRIFLLALLLSVLLPKYHYCRAIRSDRSRAIEHIPVPMLLILNLVIMTVYQLLLNAQTHYMSRIEASWGIWFYCILLVTVTITDVLHARIPKALPIALAAVCVMAIYPDGKYAISNINNVSYAACMAMDHLVIDPVVEAVAANESEITVTIPDYSDTSNAWAFGEGYGQLIADTLYHYGITDAQIHVNTLLNHDLNDRIENEQTDG